MAATRHPFHAQAVIGEQRQRMHGTKPLEGRPTAVSAKGPTPDLSQTARWYIGGLLKACPSFLAFNQPPPTNSYKRLVPGSKRR